MTLERRVSKLETRTGQRVEPQEVVVEFFEPGEDGQPESSGERMTCLVDPTPESARATTRQPGN